MKDKLIGLVILVVLCVGVVFLATSEAGLSAGVFISGPSFAFVAGFGGGLRSEEHTSELQSLVNLVCRLLLEKKKKERKKQDRKSGGRESG